MKGQVLTQVFNPFFPFFSYFNRNINTLKHYILLAILICSAFAATAQSHNNIEFVENKGQWDSRVLYKGDVSNGSFIIRNGGFTVIQHNPVDFTNLGLFLHGQNPDGTPVNPNQTLTLRSHSYNVDFLNAAADIKTVPSKIIQSYNNYLVGNDPSKWGQDCKIFQAVTLENVYPNIDVRYYTDNEFLKYDIIVKPGGDVSKIALKYNGVDKIEVKDKQLVLKTTVGELRESSPYTYQYSNKADVVRKNEINCKYVVKDNIVTFDIKKYDPSTTLIIDPQVIFCSFSGSTADNWGFTATYGADGSFYGGGIVFNTGGTFPISPGAYQTTFQGGENNGTSAIDMGIIKLSPNGSSRIYSTYIGGSGNEQPHSLIVDNQGNLVIAGRSSSPNYPVMNNQNYAGSDFDIVVTKLNASGTGIIGSKKIGGINKDGVNISASRGLLSLQRNYGDDGRSEVILDGAGNVYVASTTQSLATSGRFPIVGNPFQPNPGGGLQDGVLLKLTPDLSTLLFSSFIGGSENDAAYVLSLDPAGNIYVAGGTESNNLPGSTAGTLGPTNHGLIDGFVSQITNNGSAVIRTTYVGTNGNDQIFGIQFDNKGFPYVMGQTVPASGGWPIVNATFGNANGKQFIAKLQPNLSAFVYSTAFGSGAATPNISPIAFLVDRCENVYMSGWGGFFGNSNDFQSAGTSGLPVTPDAIKSNTDGKDLYFFVLKKDAVSQLFGSFFGENNVSPNQGSDHVDGGTSRFDRNGTIYQAICGNCRIGARSIYPVTTGSWSTTNTASGAGCNLTMVKIAMNLAGVAGGVRSAIDGTRDTAGCLPLPVIFSDTIANAQSYEWYFNYVPGNPPDLITSTPTAPYTYNAVGVYRVMLVAIDPNTCNQRDSSYLNIRVGDLRANLQPAWQPIGPGCPKFTYQFTNNSTTDISRPFLDTSMVWDFGDGSPRVPAKIGAANAVTHTYPGFGTYLPKLILKDTAYCNNPDDSTFRISIADNVKAIIETPATGCVQYNASFKSKSLNGDSFIWDFGDPSSPDNTSTLENPTHLYVNAGTYVVRLTANNPGTCNLTHDTTFTIQVFNAPVPEFSYVPDPPIVNTPTVFTNLSSPDAIRFKWVFGDGDSLITTSRAPVSHQYNSTGTFNACLTAYNVAGCDSTICHPVRALIEPLVDVPNAFTPQSGDINSVVMVKGFGIAKMQFTIWNRWGQKVFETNNRFQGWDGKVKGVVQPMDVYMYTLSVEFFDGKKANKKGDITLIR